MSYRIPVGLPRALYIKVRVLNPHSFGVAFYVIKEPLRPGHHDGERLTLKGERVVVLCESLN